MAKEGRARRIAFGEAVNLRQITVLNAFKPLLRLIEAYNSENFRHRNDWPRLQRGVFYALCASLIILLVLLFLILGTWYFVDNYGHLEVLVSTLPLLLTILRAILIFAALITNNRVISAMIDRLQQVINQRKLL